MARHARHFRYAHYLLAYAIAAGVACLCTPGVLLAQDADPRSPESLVAHGDPLLSADALEAVENAYRQTIGDCQASTHLGLARLALQDRDWPEAMDHVDRALACAPGSLEAHYLRGIALREHSKFHTLHNYLFDPEARARADFEFVLHRDALYRDARYQYALFKSYEGHYVEAIEMGHEQIRRKPGLTNAQAGLFKIYRRFIKYAGTEDALAWLEQQFSDHARYFEGEAVRRAGNEAQSERLLRQADEIFAALLAEDDLGLPVQPVLLSRAKVHYALDDPETAQAFIIRAVEAIEGETGALLVFEDFKYIMTPKELARFCAIDRAAGYRRFFQAMWAERDPTPERAVNVRLAEHYRRLLKAARDFAYYGFRTWYNNPDKLGELELPATYWLATEFTDRGIVYLRHGEPDDWAATGPTNVSWHYTQPEMDFHFAAVGVGDARLVPIPDKAILEDILLWDAEYISMLRAPRRVRYDLIEQSRAYVVKGLTTDRYR